MEEVKTFKYRINTATIIFLVALVFYTLFTAFTQDLQSVLVIGIFTILSLGCVHINIQLKRRN